MSAMVSLPGKWVRKLALFADLAHLADPAAFAAMLAPLRRSEWVVYAKRPCAGPEAVLAYLSPYPHRVAISNSRLLALDDHGVTFRWKDYRARNGATGRAWIKTMTLRADEFIRRFLLHVLPDGFHRIRHYTARAFQVHPLAGTFAGVALGLNGLVTALLVPLLLPWLLD